MDRLNRGTPMEFSWDNGKGPVDESSPFIRHTAQTRLNKRTYSNFDSSPSKNPQLSYPTLRPPHNERVLFSDLPMEIDCDKPLPSRPPTKAMASLFSTPRKMETDFSSGGETPETPGNNGDSEATPDGAQPFRFHGASEVRAKSPKKKRDSIFGDLWKRSPGKVAADQMMVTRSYSKNGEKRVTRRRQQMAVEVSTRRRRNNNNADQYARADDNDSDIEEVSNPRNSKLSSSSTNPNDNRIHPIASFLSYLESHPHLPHILSFYAQLALNLFLIFGAMYILYSFWATIRSDVNDKAREASAEILAEMAVCAKHYRENGCAAVDTIAPALKNLCIEWERCTNRDPLSVGRARVSAHTFAEIFNSFIEPISYKAMVFALIFTFGLITLCNVAFGLIRRQQANDPYMQQYSAVPPTPIRQVSGGYQYGMYTPYGGHQQQRHMIGGQEGMLELEPAPSGYAGAGADRSPTKG